MTRRERASPAVCRQHSARLADPLRQVPLRPRRQRALSGDAALGAAQALARFVHPRLDDRGKEAEIDVHRLERAGAGVDRFDMAAGDVVEKRADRRRRRRRIVNAQAEPFGGGEAPGDEADRRALDIALAAGDLAGEAQPWRRP